MSEQLSGEEIRSLYETEGTSQSMYAEDEYRGEFNWYRVEVLRAFIQETVDKVHPRNALDIGSGEGVFSNSLRELGVPVTSLDLSLSFLRRIQSLGRNSALVQGDCAVLPFAARSFDLVMALDIVEHVPCYEQAIGEISRVAQRAVIISTSIDGHHRTLARWLGVDVKAQDLKFGHLHIYKYEKLMRIWKRNLNDFEISRPAFLFVTPFYLHCVSLRRMLPQSWFRPLFQGLNYLAMRMPSLLGNWVALSAHRVGDG